MSLSVCAALRWLRFSATRRLHRVYDEEGAELRYMSFKGLSRNNCVTLWGRALACGRLQSASLKGPRRPQRPTEVEPQVETCPTSPQQRVHDWNGYFMTMPKPIPGDQSAEFSRYLCAASIQAAIDARIFEMFDGRQRRGYAHAIPVISTGRRKRRRPRSECDPSGRFCRIMQRKDND